MNPNLSEWINLLLRWFHIFAGILWVGQTFFFAWLDRVAPPSEAPPPPPGPAPVDLTPDKR